MFVNSANFNIPNSKPAFSAMNKKAGKADCSMTDSISFSANKEEDKKEYKNPIIPGFEYLDATKATVLAGVGAAARALFWLYDADFVEELNKTKSLNLGGREINLGEKHRGLKLLSLICIAIGGLYFLTHLPKNLYNKKKEVFHKKNQWNEYNRVNEAEKNLFATIDKKAQAANAQERQKLAQDWLKLKTARQEGAYKPLGA